MMLLEEIFKEKKAQHSDAFNLRIQRSLSWLKQSTEQQDHIAFKWVSLWIAFHAIYAENESISQHPDKLKPFIQRLVHSDQQGKIKHLLYSRLAASVETFFSQTRSLQHADAAMFKSAFTQYSTEKYNMEHTGTTEELVALLHLLMQRLYALYDQMLKGGMSYASRIHEEQIALGTQLMSFLVPTYIQLLVENTAAIADAELYYPVRHMH